MPRLTLDMSGFDDLLRQLNQIGADTEKATDEALTKVFKSVTYKAENAIQKPNLPAQGKYSNEQRTEKSLKHDPRVEWKDTTASIKTGFDMKKSGLTSIFLMYGTPKMAKVQGLYDAFFSDKTKTENKEIITKAMDEALWKGI